MGTLIGWRYPTNVAARLADHTYVSCGTGTKAWSCWGGKNGGTTIRQGVGSTARADAIAEPDERAGITCYLINGVCHQAANRILIPAGITVRGARGYWVSEALYGTYGRPRGFLRLCRAPFDRHQNVQGDLPECTSSRSLGASAADGDDSASKAYLGRVLGLYQETGFSMFTETPTPEALMEFQLNLFDAMAEFKLGAEVAWSETGRDLRGVRIRLEEGRLGLEQEFAEGRLRVDEFVSRYNQLTETFQNEIESVGKGEHYEALFELNRGERVVLGDLASARACYGEYFKR